MPPKHATVQIDETYIGDGVLDYDTYLREIDKLKPSPTLMIEHLNESQLIKGLKVHFQEGRRSRNNVRGFRAQRRIGR